MKALDVAKYFITLNDQKCESQEEKNDLSNLKIQKLLYYAQGYYLALYNKPLFEEKIQAWTHGPVVKEVYQHFKKDKDKNTNFIPTKDNKMQDSEIKQIEQKDKDLINDVFLLMGQYSAWRLRDKTHEEDPWRDYYKKGENVEIPQSALKKYFKQYVEIDE